METRRSILLLMNGFGLEVPKSFNIYTEALMPSLAKLSNYYPFGALFASGVEVGLNRGQLSSFREGYSAFSSVGKVSKKSNIFFFEILLCNPGWPLTPYVAEDDLGFLILLLPPGVSCML